MSRLSLSLPLLVAAVLATLLALVSAENIHLSSPDNKHHIGTTVPHISDHLAKLSAPRIASAPSELSRRRHHHKNKSATYIPNAKITYYYGSQLLNPACPGAQTPNDGSMTAAISFDSPFQCGDRIRIQGEGGKSVVVTAVDRCAGCTRKWIDVTKGVFKHFSGLDTGVLQDLTLSKE